MSSRYVTSINNIFPKADILATTRQRASNKYFQQKRKTIVTFFKTTLAYYPPPQTLHNYMLQNTTKTPFY